MPDLNSLPPSQSPSPTPHIRPSLSPQVSSPLSRSPTSTTSTPAPAQPSMTGSPRVPRSPHIQRRRSSLLRDWSLNESSSGNINNGSGVLPSPSNTNNLIAADLHSASYHHRTPSLGELHQELENEQEAQVNRLLAMIRLQQAQLQQSQPQAQAQAQHAPAQHPHNPQHQTFDAASATAVASSTPGSSLPSSTVPSRSQSIAMRQQQSQHQPTPSATANSASMPPPSFTTSLSRQSSLARRGDDTRSRTSSHSLASSPSIRPHSTDVPDWTLPGMSSGGVVGRDEVAFYQAETAMVQRENTMLKGRIRELERMLQGQRVDGAVGDGDENAGGLA